MTKFSKHLNPDIFPALLYELSYFFFEPLEVTTTFIFVFQMVILKHEKWNYHANITHMASARLGFEFKQSGNSVLENLICSMNKI